MRSCRFCGETIADQDEICGNCGYNPQTDTLTANFVKKNKKPTSWKKQTVLGSGVKTFAWWGMVIILISLGVKYQGKFGDIIWKAKNFALGNKTKPSAQAQAKASQNIPTRLIDVRSYKSPVDKSADKDRKIEGIFYDPKGKSYVVINGQLVSEKESFGKMVIQKINSDSVEVLEDGNQLILRVHQ